jgi:uncharacterized protein (DUF1697 family)
MPRFAAFLRGINLGGRRLKNEELRAAVETIGFENVAIFRASGNVVLDSPGSEDAEEISVRLEAGLAEALGYDVPVFVRSAAQLRAIDRHEPFDRALVEASAGKLQVALLPGPPTAGVRKEALALATPEDRLAIRGRELYWLPSGRMADATVDFRALESLLGPWTMRTKGTIEQIAAKHFGG